MRDAEGLRFSEPSEQDKTNVDLLRKERDRTKSWLDKKSKAEQAFDGDFEKLSYSEIVKHLDELVEAKKQCHDSSRAEHLQKQIEQAIKWAEKKRPPGAAF